MSDNIKHPVAIEDLSHSLKIIKDYVDGKTNKNSDVPFIELEKDTTKFIYNSSSFIGYSVKNGCRKDDYKC